MTARYPKRDRLGQLTCCDGAHRLAPCPLVPIPPSEAQIQQETLLRLGARPDFRCWRNNVGAMRGENGRVVRFGVPGSADVMGVLSVPAGAHQVGVFVGVELKSAAGRLTPDQVRFRTMVERLGGVYILARSADDAEAQLNAARDRLKGWLCR